MPLGPSHQSCRRRYRHGWWGCTCKFLPIEDHHPIWHHWSSVVHHIHLWRFRWTTEDPCLIAWQDSVCTCMQAPNLGFLPPWQLNQKWSGSLARDKFVIQKTQSQMSHVTFSNCDPNQGMLLRYLQAAQRFCFATLWLQDVNLLRQANEAHVTWKSNYHKSGSTWTFPNEMKSPGTKKKPSGVYHDVTVNLFLLEKISLKQPLRPDLARLSIRP